MLPAVVLCILTLTGGTLSIELPAILKSRPGLDDYDWKRRVSGVVPNREELMEKPRVIFGYLSEKEWAFIEFLCFTHASWRYVTSMAEDMQPPTCTTLPRALPSAATQPTGYRLDLLVFAEQRWLREASSICTVIDLDDVRAGSYEQLRRPGHVSTCWVLPYPRPPADVWQNYPFVASYHYLADNRVGELMTTTYGYAMKTDFDCFITATLIQHFPRHFEVGCMDYTPQPGTAAQLQRIAGGLGLRHRGRHNIGPTWYGDVATVIALANTSLPLVYFLLDQEFQTHADGSWRQNWASGEGWPLWSKDMAVMYAPDIVLNHMVDNFDISQRYDVHGDSGRYTFTLYHIHCQHGDGNFSKFEFFKHKYHDRDITTGLDFNVVGDYALWLSVTTWRHVMAMQEGGEGAIGGVGLGEEAVGGVPEHLYDREL